MILFRSGESQQTKANSSSDFPSFKSFQNHTSAFYWLKYIMSHESSYIVEDEDTNHFPYHSLRGLTIKLTRSTKSTLFIHIISS